jgi:hypothetical protein
VRAAAYGEEHGLLSGKLDRGLTSATSAQRAINCGC